MSRALKRCMCCPAGEVETIKDLLARIRARGVGKVVLDLRNVAWGDLQESVKVANLFIKDGEIARVIGRETTR